MSVFVGENSQVFYKRVEEICFRSTPVKEKKFRCPLNFCNVAHEIKFYLIVQIQCFYGLPIKTSNCLQIIILSINVKF